MQVLNGDFIGLHTICEGCGCLLFDIKPSDIYGSNLVYCPLCKQPTEINYDKNYEGIVKEEKKKE